jgi:hypothetical protein
VPSSPRSFRSESSRMLCYHWVNSCRRFGRWYCLHFQDQVTPLDSSCTAWPWRWRHHDPSERPELFTQRYGVTSPNTRIFYNEARGFPKSLQCPDNTSITPLPLPPKLLPIHHSRTDLPPTVDRFVNDELITVKFSLPTPWRRVGGAEVSSTQPRHLAE